MTWPYEVATESGDCAFFLRDSYFWFSNVAICLFSCSSYCCNCAALCSRCFCLRSNCVLEFRFDPFWGFRSAGLVKSSFWTGGSASEIVSWLVGSRWTPLSIMFLCEEFWESVACWFIDRSEKSFIDRSVLNDLSVCCYVTGGAKLPVALALVGDLFCRYCLRVPWLLF